MNAAPPAPAVPLPSAPTLVARGRRAVWVSADGEIEELAPSAAGARAGASEPFVCHAPATAAKLGLKRLVGFDLLELFAFVRPAKFCVPTPGGLAAAVGLPAPADLVSEAVALRDAADALLRELRGEAGNDQTVALAQYLSAAAWNWAPAVLQALGAGRAASGQFPRPAIWSRLPEWSETAPVPAPGHEAVAPEEALQRLSQLLSANSEARAPQRIYAAEAARAFAPRHEDAEPEIVLAEAGTGVGKTLGYIAPASVWAEKNGGVVWLSTYTRNLQRQIDTELDRLYPDPVRKHQKVVVRKGRENYLCLLNLDEESSRALGGGVAIGLVARWAAATRDGDLGGDFPAWLVGVLGAENTLGLSDRRGECIYSACRHYKKCFIERSQRRARRADLVIANHALVLATAARAEDGREMQTRFVFDEGHHVFDAADAAFSAHLTGQEASELRRWVRGPEGGRHRRARGLEARAGDLVSEHPAAQTALMSALRAAAGLPAPGWLGRMRDGGDVSVANPAEAFLAHVHAQVLARQTEPDPSYGLETTAHPPLPALLDAANELERTLLSLAAPLKDLARLLAQRLDDESATMETETRARIEAVCRGLMRRAGMVDAWAAMLHGLEDGTPETFVDWLTLDRVDGREIDVGMHRHWIDPTLPFAEVVLSRAHGTLITSASLRDSAPPQTHHSESARPGVAGVAPQARKAPAPGDGAGADDEDADWRSAEVRTGAHHLAVPPRRVSLASPFDYPNRTRVFLVTDVRRDSMDLIAAAYRELFLAAGGGGLGLFTAISRLRAVYKRILEPLEQAGIPLLAQHVDAMDTATLVDIFRAETDTCLLGTDAVRDGVDVPGDSLRLIVFDRVPWPRPDILHRARKEAFGGARYDDMIARLRLRQAYGRLVRKATDRGVFVLLDPRTPSRLLSAFPPGVSAERVGLAEAVAAIRGFLSRPAAT
ncbi:MAG: ATP-dependent DNA helicase [Alphaproteobacteria bacterium]|nr:ATP-dependent DNA helicase [Alphaproteobacteria bacterium]